MSTQGLAALFRPRSVAIVGASNDPNKVGGRPISFLLKAGWRGRLLPVNPTAAMVQGVPAYSSLDQIDGAIDQVIVAVQASQASEVVDQCIRRGVRSLQIFSAGFGEGAGASDALAKLKRATTEHGIRILGPNSLGLFNAIDGYFGTFATALDGAWPKAGGIGVATQSGAFGSYFFGLAQQRGLGFSQFIATGNEADVDIADCIFWLAEDASTRLIVVAMEGCRDGRKLAAALHAARQAGKPVLAMKVGSSEVGALAAATHTGALSGGDKVFEAVMGGAGAFRATSMSELVDAAYLATVGPLPLGRRLMVITTSGGVGVLTADAADDRALALPALSDSALTDIRKMVPLADGRNPVDTSAGILSDLSIFARVSERALGDQEVDSVLLFVAHIPRNPAHWAQLRDPLVKLRKSYPTKAFAIVGLADSTISSDLEQHGFAVFQDPGSAVAALAACAPNRWRSVGRLPNVSPAKLLGLKCSPLSEQESKSLLVEHGLKVVREKLVVSAQDAMEAAETMGYPLVLKVVSPDIPHKTEIGGVVLDLKTREAVGEALLAMETRVVAKKPDARIDGFLLARQVIEGVEILVGTTTDPVFGPVITVGAGGVLAEVAADVCIRLAPVSEAEALDMLKSTRVWRLLEGHRGKSAANVDALANQISAISTFAWDYRDEISSIDINPMLACAEDSFALDALIVMHGEVH